MQKYFHVVENVLTDGSKTYDVTIQTLHDGQIVWFPAESQATAEKVCEALNGAMDAALA